MNLERNGNKSKKMRDICVIVPAFNEEKVIEAAMMSLRKLFSAKHIYVVSDGSSDATVSIAQKYTENVLPLHKNLGKAHALQALIQQFTLTERYRYILFTDADSQLTPQFLVTIKKELGLKPACVVGTVESDHRTLISAYRSFEYALSHRFHKRAQDILGGILVAPGCCSLYRADVLEQLVFRTHTLTEDFDLTLQVQIRKLGRVIYVPSACVITQDPLTLHGYWQQISRWYTGFWQNVKLHKPFSLKSAISLEIYLAILDSISWLVLTGLLVLKPWLIIIAGVTLALSVIGLSLWLLILEQRYWALRYLPLFLIFPFINVAAMINACYRVFKPSQKNLRWEKVDRYLVSSEASSATIRA